MRSSLVPVCVIFALCSCVKAESPKADTSAASSPVPSATVQKVRIPDQQLQAEAERIVNLPPEDSQKVTKAFLEKAMKVFDGKTFDLVTMGTDSMNAGLDGWRGCDKFNAQQLGLPADTLVQMLDENMRACTSTSGYVMAILVAGPTGVANSIVSPVYKSEKMVVARMAEIHIDAKQAP